MNRRGFLGAMLGAMAAPAVVKAENLMRIVVPKQDILVVSDQRLEMFKSMVGQRVIVSPNDFTLRKILNNGVSGGCLPKQWFMERPSDIHNLTSGEVRKMHREWLISKGVLL